VLGRLEEAIERLHAGVVSTEELVERNRVSQPLEGYSQNTRNVAALQRARDQGLAVHPGQDIEYVVVDDGRSSRERVALAHEEVEDYDPSYYETQLIRAVESLLSPLGWNRSQIRRELATTQQAELLEYAWCDG
jgi:DNA polymerase I